LVASSALTAAHCVRTRSGRVPSEDIRFAASRIYDQAAAFGGGPRIRLPKVYRYAPRSDRIGELATDVAVLELKRAFAVDPLHRARYAG
jgi:hypothetical protein